MNSGESPVPSPKLSAAVDADVAPVPPLANGTVQDVILPAFSWVRPVVTPVPPRFIFSVPEAIFVAFNPVKLEPLPIKEGAVIFPDALIAPDADNDVPVFVIMISFVVWLS